MSERRMLLRSRIALITAVVVAVSIAGVSAITWFVTQKNLLEQLDVSMAHQLPPPPGPDHPHPDPGQLCRDPGNPQLQHFLEGVQVLHADGTGCAPSGVDEVLTGPADYQVTGQTFRDGTTRSGASVRVLITPIGSGTVLLTSRSLAPVDDTLAGLGSALLVVSLLGVAVAGAAGWLLSRSALTPMERLTRTAEHITRTEDLGTEVDVSGRDEVGRLGRAFAAMTRALAESRRRQHDLVSDAAHELRTPLTSLRTNIDLLARSEQTGRALPAEHRAKILASLQTQAREFGDLVNELVTLARDERELEHHAVSMKTVVDRAVRRAADRTHDHVFDVDVPEWTVTGDATALERMVLNLLDNAVKFSPAESTVTVRSAPGWVTVADQGEGVAAADRTEVFGRFWRAPQARALPGSGLGLAIVANTVTAHGGSVRVMDSAAGAVFRIDLPIG